MEQTNWYVYVLCHQGLRNAPITYSYYTGVSADPERRLKQHNSGRVTATKGRQWRSILVLGPMPQQEAFRFEHALKSGATRKKRDALLNACIGHPRPVPVLPLHYYCAGIQPPPDQPRPVVWWNPENLPIDCFLSDTELEALRAHDATRFEDEKYGEENMGRTK